MATTPSWVMTYSSLTSTVLTYLERSDPVTVAAIPTFITLAEFEIAQEIKTLGQLQVVTATMQAGSPTLQKPALRFLTIERLSKWESVVNLAIRGTTQARRGAHTVIIIILSLF